MVIDTHVHLCDPDRFAYKWAVEAPYNVRSTGPSDFEAVTAGLDVTCYIAVEGAVGDADVLVEVEWLAVFAAQDPRLAGIIAALRFDADCRPSRLFGPIKEMALVKGFRILTKHAPVSDLLTARTVVEAVRSLGDGLFCHLCVPAHELPQALGLVRQCPDNQFVLDHTGKPDIAAGHYALWASGMAALAQCPNIVCKLSGMDTAAVSRLVAPSEIGRNDMLAALFAPYIDTAITAFGVDRIMFGSDWHMVERATSYRGWLEIVRHALTGYADHERQAIFHDNAARLYRL